MGFKEEFAKLPPGPQREALVYRAIISRGKPTDLWPVTVSGPDGSKITYYVTRDFLNLDGVWLPMTGTTAQKVADYFGMHLPTNKISEQVWKAATTQIRPAPLSGTGYQSGDKYYSPKDVVNTRINATDAALAYSQKIQEEQAKNKDSKPGIVAGHMKDITVPPASGSLGLHGWYDSKGEALQKGYGTIHPNYEEHTEYGSGVRLVDDRVTVEYPDGQKKDMTMSQLAASDLRTALFEPGHDLQEGKIRRYDLKRDKASLAKIDKEIGGAQPEDTQIAQKFKEIDDLLEQLGSVASNRVAGRMLILRRVLDEYLRRS